MLSGEKAVFLIFKARIYRYQGRTGNNNNNTTMDIVREKIQLSTVCIIVGTASLLYSHCIQYPNHFWGHSENRIQRVFNFRLVSTTLYRRLRLPKKWFGLSRAGLWLKTLSTGCRNPTTLNKHKDVWYKARPWLKAVIGQEIQGEPLLMNCSESQRPRVRHIHKLFCRNTKPSISESTSHTEQI